MSMGTTAGVSEEEYLGTAYEPDCEFEDGVLIERNLGEQDHSWLQTALAAYFFRRRRLWGGRSDSARSGQPDFGSA